MIKNCSKCGSKNIYCETEATQFTGFYYCYNCGNPTVERNFNTLKKKLNLNGSEDFMQKQKILLTTPLTKTAKQNFREFGRKGVVKS